MVSVSVGYWTKKVLIVSYFFSFSSGTYNNQYMVIDKKRISGELLDGTLTVVEQIPGLVKTGDQTAILRAGW